MTYLGRNLDLRDDGSSHLFAKDKRFHYAYMFPTPIFSYIISKHLLSHFYGPDTVETGMNKNQTDSQKPLSLLGKRAGTLYTVSSTVKI